jgi:membrane-bound ClpP family serine protease
MDTPDLKQPEPRKHLAGSKGADIVLGIIAGVLWWGVGFSFYAAEPSFGGIILVIGIVALVIQSIWLISKRSYSRRFVTWQILTVVLAPVLAFGLLFGACLLGGGLHLG